MSLGGQDGASADPPEVFEEYRLRRLLGEGAMGQVWLAEDTLLERLVAIKLVRSASPSAAARADFFQEARALARLLHPNVVAVHRVGEVRGRPYLVSEYVRGQPLDQLPLPLPWPRALAIGIDLARGLAAAHGRGVLHRDIKPANAILTEEGVAKLLDFGLAELSSEADATSEQDASVHAPAAGQRSVERALREAQTKVGREAAGLEVTATADQDPTITASPTAEVDPVAATGRGDVFPHDAARPPATRRFAGTPLYVAPEIVVGEAATPRADVYSLGALLYELCAGAPRFAGLDIWELFRRVREEPAPRLESVVPDIHPRFADAVARCLDPDPARRFPSADALREALERVGDQAPAEAAIPEGNPYRGLLPFGPEHRQLFFGRGDEIRRVVSRVEAQPFVLVVGDSGVGKSSLCRAGVLPALAAHRSPKIASLHVLTLVPGRRPLRALAAALTPILELSEADVEARLRDEAGFLPRAAAARREGLLLFIDQLEELCTLAEPDEAAAFAGVLRDLTLTPGPSRALATARSDFLGRLAALPGLGDDLASCLHVVPPLTAQGLREAIVGPARAHGVEMESNEMVDELANEALRAPGGLPLLEFALAALWDDRDAKAGVIRGDALRALGGVAGALSRHADAVLASLPQDERGAASALLRELATDDRIGAAWTRSELLSRVAGGRAAERALEALVRGRLVVARDMGAGEPVCAVAHEALIEGWDTLRGWLGHDAETRAIRGRLSRAAAEWQRLARPAEALWTDRQLRDAASLDEGSLGEVERAFLDAARRASRRRTILRWSAVIGAPLAIGLTALIVRIQANRAVERDVELRVSEATRRMSEGMESGQVAEDRRRKALERFDAWDEAQGERLWTEMRAAGATAETSFTRAAEGLEIALMLSGGRADLRGRLADALFERAKLLDGSRRFRERDELLERLRAYDEDGKRLSEWNTPGKLVIRTSPPGARVSMSRVFDKDGRREEAPPELLGESPIEGRACAAGSIVLRLEAESRAPVRLPLWVNRGETITIDVPLPRAGDVPPDFVYVPAGRFLFGSQEPDEDRRRSERQPIHPRTTGPFLIATREVTFGAWIDYLRALPPDERGARTPKLKEEFHAVELRATDGGPYQLTLKPSAAAYTAAEGEPIRYPDRAIRAVQDWSKMPVSAISYEDAKAYAAWLDATGRVPRARLCDPFEWERAARGADDRLYTSGDLLAPDDANHDATYGRKPLAFGPDEVGSHPRSRSPFGVDDMTGNVWEWLAPFTPSGPPVARGGSYYQVSLDGRVFNFEKMEPEFRSALIGVRLCATPGGAP